VIGMPIRFRVSRVMLEVSPIRGPARFKSGDLAGARDGGIRTGSP
jgi:hypothetical protein